MQPLGHSGVVPGKGADGPDGATVKSLSEHKVSIGLPVFNGQRYMEETIKSLLAQTYSDFELVISDNASTDATAEIGRDYAASDPRVRYFRVEKNRGAAWNFNNAFQLARGEYFKWAADDDLHHPLFLEKCFAVMENDPSVVLCFAGTLFIDEHGKSLGEYKYPVEVNSVSRRELFMNFASSGHIVHEIFGLIRADILRKTALIGSYVGSDLILLGALALQGRFHQVDECLFMHREHPGRSTIASKDSAEFTRWYDSSKTGRMVLPRWRRLFEHVRTVARSQSSLKEKSLLYYDLCRAANWQRRALFDEVFRVFSVTGKPY